MFEDISFDLVIVFAALAAFVTLVLPGFAAQFEFEDWIEW